MKWDSFFAFMILWIGFAATPPLLVAFLSWGDVEITWGMLRWSVVVGLVGAGFAWTNQ